MEQEDKPFKLYERAWYTLPDGTETLAMVAGPGVDGELEIVYNTNVVTTAHVTELRRA